MKARSIRTRQARVLLFLAVLAIPTLLAAACGSEDESPAAIDTGTGGATAETVVDEEAFPILRPTGVYTVDDLVSAGWKKSKQYETETVPGATDIWLGFFNAKDIEVRFYESHEDAASQGITSAEEATERPARKGGGVKGAGTFAITKYPAYLVVGNVVMLCELEVATCQSLVDKLN